MEKSIGLLLLQQMLGLKDFKTDTCRELLEKTIKDNNNNIRELAKLMGVDEYIVQSAIKSLREMLKEQARERGISVVEMFDLITKK